MTGEEQLDPQPQHNQQPFGVANMTFEQLSAEVTRLEARYDAGEIDVESFAGLRAEITQVLHDDPAKGEELISAMAGSESAYDRRLIIPNVIDLMHVQPRAAELMARLLVDDDDLVDEAVDMIFYEAIDNGSVTPKEAGLVAFDAAELAKSRARQLREAGIDVQDPSWLP